MFRFAGDTCAAKLEKNDNFNYVLDLIPLKFLFPLIV